MNCEQARDWMDGFVDGELDLAHSVEIERHLVDCPQCAATRDASLALRDRLRSPTMRPAMPIDLQNSVRAALRDARGPQRTKHSWRMVIPMIPYGAIAAMLVVGFVLLRGQSGSSEQLALRELTAAHVRSTQVDHLTDVISTDQHTVKPWFEGKLDFSPPVHDFASHGFELVGGRLDYLADRPVAAIVYRRQKHLINVFVKPEQGDATSPRAQSSNGFNIIQWRKDGMAFSAISDLNAAELTDLAKLIAAGP